MAAIADFNRTVSYTVTYFSTAQPSDVSKPFALIGQLVIRTASSHQCAAILQDGFENPLENPALRAWALEFGLNDQELNMLCHPESVSEIDRLPQGMSPAFDGLRKASRARQVGDNSQWLAVSQNNIEEGATQATAAPDPRPEPTESQSISTDMLPDAPVGEYLETPRLKAVIMPGYKGEPIIALTFSRSF